MRALLFLGFIFFMLHACDNNPSNLQKLDMIAVDSLIRQPKGELFKEDSFSFEAQRNKIFHPILNSDIRNDAVLLLNKFKASYKIPLDTGMELFKLYSVRIYGYNDSIWAMECIVKNDSLCKPHGRKQQMFFDAKGHLIHVDNAAKIRWVSFMDGKAPLLMTLNTDCEGKGYHHFYKYEQGELLDIFNVLLENTPATFDSNPSDNFDFQPQELDLKMEDRNGDNIKDIVFKGVRQQYKNGIFVKAQAIEYVFIYQPGEDWFLLKSLSK
jgi:hypothetical protein